MASKVLLIAPPFHYGRLESASPRCPPLGIAYIASYLEREGHTASILDAFALGLTEEQIRSELERARPDIVGITGVTSAFSKMRDIAKMSKEIYPDVPVIMGGPHASIMTQSCFETGNVDYAVVGEGEITTAELVGKLETGKPVHNVKGIAYLNKNGKLKLTPKRELIPNLDDLPMPAYHLLPMDAYKPYAVFDVGKKFCSMITSRGCPNFCIFCSSCALWEHKYRTHSAARVMEEMRLLYDKYGIRHFYFQDDEFTIAHHRVEKLCDMIIESKMDVIWECLARVDQMTRPLLQKMAKAGCVDILYGIESGSPKVLEKIKKRISLEQARQVCKWTKESGMWCRATFLMGLPFETKEDMRQTIDFAKSLDLDIAYFNILTPFPNTEVYRMIEEKKLFSSDADWNRWVSHGKEPVIRTESMTNKEIAEWTGRAYLEFYLRPAFLVNKLRTIKNLQHLKRTAVAGVDLVKISLGWISNK